MVKISIFKLGESFTKISTTECPTTDIINLNIICNQLYSKHAIYFSRKHKKEQFNS